MDLGQQEAALVARALRDFGYPDVTAEMVIEQMAKPAGERNIIGMMAASALEEAGYNID